MSTIVPNPIQMPPNEKAQLWEGVGLLVGQSRYIDDEGSPRYRVSDRQDLYLDLLYSQGVMRGRVDFQYRGIGVVLVCARPLKGVGRLEISVYYEGVSVVHTVKYEANRSVDMWSVQSEIEYALSTKWKNDYVTNVTMSIVAAVFTMYNLETQAN